MPAEQAPRPMAVCEICFLEEHTSWSPESMDEEGRILMKLVGVDVPNKLNNPSVETCCMCGSITIAGIFEMLKPDDVYFLEDNKMPIDFVMSLEDDEDDYEGF